MLDASVVRRSEASLGFLQAEGRVDVREGGTDDREAGKWTQSWQETHGEAGHLVPHRGRWEVPSKHTGFHLPRDTWWLSSVHRERQQHHFKIKHEFTYLHV